MTEPPVTLESIFLLTKQILADMAELRVQSAQLKGLVLAVENRAYTVRDCVAERSAALTALEVRVSALESRLDTRLR